MYLRPTLYEFDFRPPNDFVFVFSYEFFFLTSSTENELLLYKFYVEMQIASVSISNPIFTFYDDEWNLQDNKN